MILKVEFTWKDEIDTGTFMCEFRSCFTWKFPPKDGDPLGTLHFTLTEWLNMAEQTAV